MLKTLETKGYVERHTSPANRRNTLVTITEQGQMLLKATEENATNFVAELTEKIGVDKMKAYIELSKSFLTHTRTCVKISKLRRLIVMAEQQQEKKRNLLHLSPE